MLKPKEIGDYWNSVANKNIDAEKHTAADNWEKRRIMIKFLLDYPLSKDEKILEIGPGIGTTINMLQSVYGSSRIDYISIETSTVFQDFMLNIQNRPCKIATIDALPFKDNQFSRVWLFDVLEHVDPEIRAKAGQEVGRVLKPGGAIFINNPFGKGNHDDKFDFGFDQVDIGNFCEQTNTVMGSVTLYPCFVKYFYQFIVLQGVV